jgi:hypothetical protein
MGLTVYTNTSQFSLNSTGSGVFKISMGVPGPQGETGVVSATSPLAYNSTTKNLSIDLAAYATQSWVDGRGYLQAGALTGYALQSWVTSQGFLTSSSLTGYATQAWVTGQSYLTSSSLSGYATQSWVGSQGYLTSSSLSPYLLSATAASTYFPIPTGTTSQYLRGDGSLATLPSSSSSDKLTATAYNKTGATLTKGTVVYIDGTQGNLPSIAKAQANAESTSSGTYGLVSADISNMSSGTIVIAGLIDGLNLSSYVDGDKLYLSPTTAGGYTTTKPVGPNHMVYVGVVTRAHPTLGTIQLRLANGFEVDELHDVLIASKTNLDLLSYESSTGLWKNKSFSTLGLATLASPALTGTPTAPTAATATNTTQIATTAFVKNQSYVTSSSLTSTLGSYYTASVSDGRFYPISSNPSNFITSAALSGLLDQTSADNLYVSRSGGTLNGSALLNLFDSSFDSELGGWGFGVELTADTTQNASVQYNAVSVQNSGGTMSMTPSGLTFPDSTTQGTAASPFGGGTVGTPITVTGSGGSVVLGDSIGLDLSGSTAGAGVKFSDGTIQYTAATASYDTQRAMADGIAMAVNYVPNYSNYIGFVFSGSIPCFMQSVPWSLVDSYGATYGFSYYSSGYAYFSSGWSTGPLYVRVNSTTSSIPLPY